MTCGNFIHINRKFLEREIPDVMVSTLTHVTDRKPNNVIPRFTMKLWLVDLVE